MTVALGCDHGGFALKEHIKAYLEGKDYAVEDCGCFSTDSVDYPTYGQKAAQAVAEGKRFTSEDAEELLREVEVLREALPAEGKMMVRRYSGPVDRMEAVARISKSEGCGFYFF